MINILKYRILLVATLLLANIAFANQSASDNIASYRLRPLDVLSVKFFQEPDLDTVYKVSQNGNIVLPLVNAVKVSGLTVQEAQALLKKLYEKDYLVNANVSIFISEYSPRRVFVTGMVNRPGPVLIPPEESMSLLNAIANAGGVTRLANTGSLKIKRVLPDGQIRVYDIDLRAIQRNENAKDFPILEGDTIEVPESLF